MPEETEPRFETALEQLEGIVESLERGEPDLSVALAKYETGVRLLNHCYGLLERAERSVALLTGVDAQGNPITAAFDATATLDTRNTRTAKDQASQPVRGEQSASASPANPELKPARSRRTKPPATTEPDPFDPPF
jgi:exodeoxyribonuclease VII small subunit